MKVAFFASHILWKTHYETELEIIQRHLDEGDDVLQYVCDGTMLACDGNPYHAFKDCVKCMAKRRCGRSLLSHKVPQVPYPLLTDSQKLEIDIFVQSIPLDLNEFKKLRFDVFDVGYAVASSIITLLTNPYPDIREHYSLFYRHTKTACEVYCSFLNRLAADKPDRLYIFNGRLAEVKAAFRAANKLKIPCYIHERGGNLDRYGIFKNHLPHDIGKMDQLMRDFWNENPDIEEKKRMASYFYEKRRNGVLLSWKSYTDKQVNRLLPDNFDPAKRNIVIFNSSDFEFAAIGPEWNYVLYKNQYDAIMSICKDLASNEDIHFYLRLHPNLATADKVNFDIISNFISPNLTLIKPDSLVDSYELLDASEKVITFGSTMGMEATWWNKPSILGGPCLYENFKSIYKPASHKELLALIEQKDLPACDKSDAEIFGYYTASFGTKYKYYIQSDYKGGLFKSTPVTSALSRYERTLMKIYWRYGTYRFIRSSLERLITKKLNAGA